MLRLKTKDQQSYLLVKNPNDTLDLINSIAKEFNNTLEINNEKTIGHIKMIYGSSKKTSEQDSKEYEGVKAFVTLIKKSLASIGNNGYFQGSKDRWKYSTIDDNNNRKLFKKYDNHIKINFKCKTAKERETLKSLSQLVFDINKFNLNCDICDLDYIEDVETIKDDMFEFNVYIYARTVLKFEYDNNHNPLEQVDYIVGLHNPNKETNKEEQQKIEEEKNDKDNIEFENGF